MDCPVALIDDDLLDPSKVLLELDEGVNIESGATLYGTGQINIGDTFRVESGGILMSGATDPAVGLLEIIGGDLRVDDGSTLKFGVNALVARDTEEQRNSSIITVGQNVIFESGSTLEVDVQQGAYIPTAPSQQIPGSVEFVLLEAAGFVNENNAELKAGAP